MTCIRILIVFINLLSTSQSVRAKPFRVAALYPTQTGSDDFICITKAVIRTANEHDGVSVDLGIFNTGNDVISTIASAKEIVAQKFDAVVGTRASQEALASAIIFNDAKIPFFVPLSSNPEITENKKYVLRLLSDSNRYASLLAQYAAINLNAKRIAIVSNLSLAYSTDNTRIFTDELARIKPKVPLINFKILEGHTAFKQTANEISKFAPDLVYLPLYSPQTAALLTELKKLHLKSIVLSNSGVWDGAHLFTNKSNPVTDIRFLFNGIWNLKPGGPHGRRFLQILEKDCKNAGISARTGPVFDAAQWLIDTHKSDPKLRSDAFVAKAMRLKFLGVMGPFERDKTGTPVRNVPIFEMTQNGEKYIETVP